MFEPGIALPLSRDRHPTGGVTDILDRLNLGARAGDFTRARRPAFA